MCAKKPYDKRGAESALNMIKGGLRKFQNRREKRMYHCMVCDAWHLTSMDEPSFDIRGEEINNEQFKKYLQQ